MPIFNSLRSRLARILASDSHEASIGPKAPIRGRASIQPSIRRLEPRFVLNASAELTSLGQLVITGTNAADFVRLDVDSLGQITLQDAFGGRIDIVGNPDGQTQPLNPDAIFSKQIQVNLQGGNDTFDIAIPSGLNVSVVEGDGVDTVKIIHPDSPQPNLPATHQLEAESIRFDASLQPIDWRNQNFQLKGDVYVGSPLSPAEIRIDGGSWEVSGRLILQGDVNFSADALGGSIDLSGAILSADEPSTTLTVDIGNTNAAVLRLGNIDNSATQSIESLSVNSANTVQFQSSTFNLPGELSIQNVSDNLIIGANVTASSISLQATNIVFMDVALTTDTGDIRVDGPVTLASDLELRTSNGDVTFTSTVDGNHFLLIDAGNGSIAFQNDFGTVDPLSAIDLTGSVISVHSLVTSDGGISIAASGIELFGGRIETLQSGDILFDSPVTVHGMSVEVRSSGNVQFTDRILGNIGNESLGVVADNNINVNGRVTSLASFSMEAMNQIQLLAELDIHQDIYASANRLTILENISIGSLTGGSITLIGQDQIVIGAGLEISAGSGQLSTHGPMSILGNLDLNAQGGTILLNSTIDGSGALTIINPGGDTTVQNAIGGLQPLVGLNLLSNRISINTAVVQNNSIQLTADRIEITGQSISTLDSGNIIANGDMVIVVPFSTISAADSVQISGVVRGQNGVETLTITANDQIELLNGAQSIATLVLQSHDVIHTTGVINANQEFSATSDTVIISGDLNLLSGPAGAITLDGKERVQIDNQATVSIGNGTLTIQTEGIVEIADSTITSDSASARLLVRGTNIITLGSVDLSEGLIDLRTIPVSTATISQAPGTTVTASRVRIDCGGDVLLMNIGNDIQTLEDLVVTGDLRIRDDIGDLTIDRSSVFGTTYEVRTASDLHLLENAITAEQAAVSLHAGKSILNSATDLQQYNIHGKTLAMTATTGIGFSAPISLQSVRSIDAVTVDGGINLQQDTSDHTTLERLAAETGMVKFEQFGQSSLLVESISSASDGVSVVNHGGSIRLSVSPVGGSTISGGEFGTISIQAGVTIDMSDGSRIDADRGSILLHSVGDVTIGGLKTIGSQNNAIEITSLTGSIVDGGDQDVDIDANMGGVILNAFSGIGRDDELNTSIARLTARVELVGSINLAEGDAIDLLDLITQDGGIDIVAGGTITATSIVSQNNSGTDGPFGGPSSHDIRLQARGMESDILVQQITASKFADVLLVAEDDVLGVGAALVAQVIADDLKIIAGNASADGDNAVSLTTNVDDLLLEVNGTARGDAEIREVDSLFLASSDRSDDGHQLSTSNGEIRIRAGHAIFLLDGDPQNDLVRPLADPEIVAGGSNGRIALFANDKVELGNQTQMVATESTVGAVRIESHAVVFGESIEINTGSGTAIAKHFLPRPAAEEMGTAFYDATSVSTNTLTQENAKDAKGVLTVKIGLPGERGLQVDIDWGAPSNRFQTITNVSADNSRLVDGTIDVVGPNTDEALLQVSHVYLESDILNSVLNGRRSATGPLNVLFSVSHHESIIIQADSVTQGFDESGGLRSMEIVGRLVSSTDNPLTAGALESGTARFIVPNLSIPVAFFPVREIIPETVKPESLSRPVDAVAISTGSLESESGSASSLVTRDEYFQIRILSPDPFGEDLAEPKRLPDDILSGDKLQRLFKNLPDGRYEVGYVFGDGNVRSLLIIDNRDGVTKVLGQQIEGGPLRLERLAPLEIDLDPIIDSQSELTVPIDETSERSAAEADPDLPVDPAKAPSVEDHSSNSRWGTSESMASVTIVGGLVVNQLVTSGSTKLRSSVNRFSLVGRFLSRKHASSDACN